MNRFHNLAHNIRLSTTNASRNHEGGRNVESTLLATQFKWVRLVIRVLLESLQNQVHNIIHSPNALQQSLTNLLHADPRAMNECLIDKTQVY